MTTPSKADVLRVAGEPVVVVFRNSSGQIHLLNGQGDALDMSKHIGASLYTEAQALAMYAAGIESAKSEGWRQCAVGQHTSQFCGQLEAAVAAEREVSDKLWAALELVLPMAKGYAVANRVGSNDAYIKLAAAALTEVAAIRSKGEQA